MGRFCAAQEMSPKWGQLVRQEGRGRGEEARREGKGTGRGNGEGRGEGERGGEERNRERGAISEVDVFGLRPTRASIS